VKHEKKMTPLQVMVVEDENVIAKDIENNLKGLGYSVPAVVSSGKEAIQKAAETHPNLVLMDIDLKGDMDGVEAAQQIDDYFNIPVIYLTTYADKNILDILDRAKVTKSFGYIIKPFSGKKLHAAINLALERQKILRELENGKQWFGAIHESLYNAVVAIDKKGCVRFMNSTAEILTGWKQEEALGEDWIKGFNIINKKTKKVDENPVTKALEESAALSLTNNVVIAKDGTEISIEGNIVRIKGNRGNIVGAVLICQSSVRENIPKRCWLGIKNVLL